LEDRAAWFANFTINFGDVAVGLGFTLADSTAVQADNDIMQFLLGANGIIDAYKDAARQYRLIITEGDIGDPTPLFPAAIGPTPATPVATGIYQRLIELVDRIRAAPAYTDEIGALLGIIPQAAPVPEGDVVPVLKLEAMPGNVVSIKFVRGRSDGIAIERQLDNESEWTAIGNFAKSPVELSIPANTNNLPRAVRLRARYVDGNTPVGLNSDTVNVVTTP
jgi:hypothetical protein